MAPRLTLHPRVQSLPGLFVAGVVLALCLSSAACGSESKPATATTRERIVISGSGAVVPIAEKLAQAYVARHPEITFSIEPGTNSGGAISGVMLGTLDLAAVNRTLTDEEKTQPITYLPFARDAVAFAVNTASPMRSVTTAAVRDIYAGKVTNWSELGQPAGRLIVLDRDPDETARKKFLLPVLGVKDVGARAVVLTSAPDMVSTLVAVPEAFGYSAVGILRMQAATTTRSLALDGVEATRANIESGAYPWARTCAFVYRNNPSPATARFLEFVKGPAGQEILRQYEYATPE